MIAYRFGSWGKATWRKWRRRSWEPRDLSWLAVRIKFVNLESRRPPRPLFQVGRDDDAWAVPDWAYAKEDGTFGNRFDDPMRVYRVLYASSQRLGCFIDPGAFSRRRLIHRRPGAMGNGRLHSSRHGPSSVDQRTVLRHRECRRRSLAWLISCWLSSFMQLVHLQVGLNNRGASLPASRYRRPVRLGRPRTLLKPSPNQLPALFAGLGEPLRSSDIRT